MGRRRPDWRDAEQALRARPTVEPATVEPATVEPATVEPATVEPATVEPAVRFTKGPKAVSVGRPAAFARAGIAQSGGRVVMNNF
jgi:hypothetical protein